MIIGKQGLHLPNFTHMEVEAWFGVGIKYPSDALGSSHWDCALLCDDLVAIRHLQYPLGTSLDELLNFHQYCQVQLL